MDDIFVGSEKDKADLLKRLQEEIRKIEEKENE
jgi:hypothetical protein